MLVKSSSGQGRFRGAETYEILRDGGLNKILQ